MPARKDGRPRADKGTTRKYATVAERDEAKVAWRKAIQKRWREANREKLRLASKDYRNRNRQACIDRTQKWNRSNEDRIRCRILRRKYGLSLAEFNAMVEERGGRCDICSAVMPLVVDHCHAENRVRGLLCDRCNVGLGCFGDKPAALEAAARYVLGLPDYIDNWHDIQGYAKLVEDRLEPRERS